jgi:hypothetical protein
MTTLLRSHLLLATLLLTSIGLSAQADLVAFTPTGIIQNPTTTGNDGIFFTPNTSMYVTALGYYVNGLVGGAFTSERPVGIFRASDGAVLDFVTVMPGDNLIGDYRYHNLPPLLLTAGIQYAVVGWTLVGEGRQVGFATNEGPSSDLTYDGYKINFNPSLSFPTITQNGNVVAPNFTYSVVPEPSSFMYGSIACGLVLAFCIARKRCHGDKPLSRDAF